MAVHIKRIYGANIKRRWISRFGRLALAMREKKDAQIDEWFKDIAPSDWLRRWFGHQLEKWDTFYARYLDELFDTEPLAHLRDLLKKHNTLRLLYLAKEQNSPAIVTRDFLQVTNDSGTINTKGLNSNY